MKFRINLQRFGGGSAPSTTVVNETAKVPAPTAEETAMQKLALAYAQDYSYPSAAKLNTMAMAGLNKTLEPQYKELYDTYTAPRIAQISDQFLSLQNGVLPDSYKQNKQQYIDAGLSQLSSAMADQARRGVGLNGTSLRAMASDITKNSATAMANQYNQDMEMQSGLLEQGQQMAYAPVQFAAQSQQAAQATPLAWFNASLGQYAPTSDAWNNMANRRYSLKSNPTVVQTPGTPSEWGGLASGLGSIGGALIACFVAGTKIETVEGDMPIEDLKPGDMLRTLEGDQVVRAMKESMEMTVILKTSRGHIETTSTERFLADCGINTVSSLIVGDRILHRDGWALIEEVLPGTYQKVYEPVCAWFSANGFYAEGL